MGARFITDIEKVYSKRFQESRLIWMMFSYDDWYEKLLKKAIASGVALRRDDFLAYYSEESMVAIEEWAENESILAGGGEEDLNSCK